MKLSRICLVAVVFSSSLSLAGCKEPNEAERPTGPAATVPADNATDPAGETNKPGHLVAELCNIESVSGQALGAEPFKLDASSSVRGWLAEGAGRVPEQPMLILADEDKNIARQYPLALAISRPDVVKVFPDKQIPAKSGFELRLDPAGLPPKTYHLYLTYTTGGQLYVCDNGRIAQVP